MSNRNTLYNYFGPLRSEASDLVIMDELNLIRTELGLPPRDEQQMIDAMEIKLHSLPDYD